MLAPTAFASAFADAAVFELSTVSSGIELNLSALGGGGSAANCASIAGGSALAATAMWYNLIMGVHGSSDEVSPVCGTGTSGDG